MQPFLGSKLREEGIPRRYGSGFCIFSVIKQIKGNILNEQDTRCCGSGVCIINHSGECWCGQVWNGKEMVAPHSAVKDDEKPTMVDQHFSLSHDASNKQ